MTEEQLTPIYLSDYTPPGFLIETVDLTFDLDPDLTLVTGRSSFKRNPESEIGTPALVLDGEGMTLDRVLIDGQTVPPSQMDLQIDKLVIAQVPDQFELTISTKIKPAENKALEGLYVTNGRFCTQCEVQGFRRITYFLDRPDVLSRYRVELRADRKKFPVLLSNGNQVESGVLEDGRQYSVWDDPFPKPCYLFALVAGDLARLESDYETASNKTVSLNLFVEPGKEAKADYALESLKRAMDWDERVFGLEYDLDVFNIVAVSDFNMGAMENKSLNIFNDKFILADPETATDSDFAWIESVVAHEYFHNWTGNRITCRDWFQLSLKEGLTVFRDQQFSADMRSASVQRIEDVRSLRATQFAEDSGPLAHPVRPDSYAEINNFYTHTVYEKGAEVVRMVHTILGAEAFRRGMDLYIERHDGQAVTCEDFISAMADASKTSLDQFLLWYRQAGTPHIRAKGSYEVDSGVYTLSLHQTCRPPNGEDKSQPFHIPLRVGFVDSVLGDVGTCAEGKDETPCSTHILPLQEARKEYRFSGFPSECTAPIVSLNRGFSAPVIISIERSPKDLATLMAKDPDSFVRWDAAQELAIVVLIGEIEGNRNSDALDEYLRSIDSILSNTDGDPAATAQLITLPSEAVLSERMEVIDPNAIYEARKRIATLLAEENKTALEARYAMFDLKREFRPDAKDAGERALRNTALACLVHDKAGHGITLALQQYEQANNMTDRWSALHCLNDIECKQRSDALAHFSARYADEPLVLDKWLSLEAKSATEGTLERVKKLLTHPSYNGKNPNRIRALVGSFANGNAIGFHNGRGDGYKFVADQILEINQFNPQVAARLAGAFQKWKRYGGGRNNLMKTELERMGREKALSQDVKDIVTRSLSGN